LEAAGAVSWIDQLGHALHSVAAGSGTSHGGPRGQSLVLGIPGVALLPVERAKRGPGLWQNAHGALAACGRDPVQAGWALSMTLGTINSVADLDDLQ
jgi:hypothetical protein